MTPKSAWRVLGIAETSDSKAIRKAYADKLKAMDIDREAAAYAQLRTARDMALRLARSAQHADAGADTGLGDDGWSLDAPFAENEGEPGAGARDGTLNPAGGEQVLPAEERAPAEPGPDRKLYEILFPGGEHSEEGLSWEEHEAARQYLAQLIGEAHEGAIDEHQLAGYWLSDWLAGAWPRSAPLLAETVEAFGWREEHGQLSESPAVAFLNQRLRGMEFIERVEQPDHRYHKAWQELRTPGARRFSLRRKTNREDVNQLLAGIRTNFPELESYLDGQRVASWEKGNSDGGGGGLERRDVDRDRHLRPVPLAGRPG